ncbi:hypothetical protein BKA70DRAFT_1242613 [Coprinopsis sp. MPI-PUGE-AT-0042]|nr:hypothetical protein BKA70DRAFT_1242613 [Coprinopsis sp. MPI-PUGE-AT-0042]
MQAQKNGSDALSNLTLPSGGNRTLRSTTWAAGPIARLQAPPLPQRHLQQSSISAVVARRADGGHGAIEAPGANGQPIFSAEQLAHCIGCRKRVVGKREGDRNEIVTIQFDEALHRAQRALDAKKAALRNTREELGITKEELKEVREELADLTEQLETANTSKEQYRNWWINEVQFTKLILNKVPHPNQDWDLIHTSQSHYLGRF